MAWDKNNKINFHERVLTAIHTTNYQVYIKSNSIFSSHMDGSPKKSLRVERNKSFFTTKTIYETKMPPKNQAQNFLWSMTSLHPSIKTSLLHAHFHHQIYKQIQPCQDHPHSSSSSSSLLASSQMPKLLISMSKDMEQEPMGIQTIARFGYKTKNRFLHITMQLLLITVQCRPQNLPAPINCSMQVQNTVFNVFLSRTFKNIRERNSTKNCSLTRHFQWLEGAGSYIVTVTLKSFSGLRRVKVDVFMMGFCLFLFVIGHYEGLEGCLQVNKSKQGCDSWWEICGGFNEV